MIKCVLFALICLVIFPFSTNIKIKEFEYFEELNGEEEEESDDIIILHTNDVHCGVLQNIGYDGLMLYKRELQKKYKHVLTVDVGDHIQGDTIGLLSKGIDIIDIMNQIEYNVSVIGNHEFDYGLDALVNCSELLSCGYICANFCYRKNKTSIFPPYKILEVGDKKIGFLGLVTTQTLSKTYLIKITDEKGDLVYDFLTEGKGKVLYETIQKYIDEIKEKGADYIIILGHIGNEGDTLEEFTSRTILSHINGVDAWLDGHTHKVYNTTLEDKDGTQIPISQTGSKLINIGVLKIKAKGNITSELISKVPEPNDKNNSLIVKRNDIERWVDLEMNDFINNIIESQSGQLNRKIGHSNFDLIINTDPNDHHQQISRSEESTLGNLITDAIRNVTIGDISLINAGSIRTDLKKGIITYKNIIDVLPYFNDLVVKEVSGKDILDVLEMGVRLLPQKSPRFLQISGINFKVNIDVKTPVVINENEEFMKVEGDRRVFDVKIGGKKIDLDKKYRIILDAFIGEGGDGFSMFSKYDEIYNTGTTASTALIDFIEGQLNGEIPDSYKKTEGRIVIVSDKDKDNTLLIILIIVSSIVLLIVFITIIICIKMKRKKGSNIIDNFPEKKDNNLIEEY